MKQRILLVDDDHKNNIVVEKLLEVQYEVIATENGQQALELLQTSIPDIILLDWNMPVMDGLTTLKRLKADSIFKNIPVIMITGFMTDNENLLLAYNEGVIDFIRKPFDEMELLARVKSIMQLDQYYKESIIQKENEIFKSAVHLMAREKFIENILSQINEVLQANNKTEQLKYISLNLQSQLEKNIWEQVENSFLKVNPEFYKNLLEKHPNLTPSELKLAALLRLNMSSKDIANITNLSIDGIRVSRSRLKKKLLLAEIENLVSYLHYF